MATKKKEMRYTIPQVFQSVERKFAAIGKRDLTCEFVEVFGWARVVAEDNSCSICPLIAMDNGELAPAIFDMTQGFRGYVNEREKGEMIEEFNELRKRRYPTSQRGTERDNYEFEDDLDDEQPRYTTAQRYQRPEGEGNEPRVWE